MKNTIVNSVANHDRFRPKWAKYGRQIFGGRKCPIWPILAGKISLINFLQYFSISAMSAPKKVKTAERQYRKEWENDFPWLKKSPNGYPMCTYCHGEFDCKKSRLFEHEKTAIHKKNAGDPLQKKLVDTPGAIVIPKDDKVKLAEMRIAGEIAKHCPVQAVDHLSETIVMCSTCSKKGCHNPLTDLKIHRSKCTAIINNVILQP